ncbi:MAG: hypothetical protein K2U26_09180, partial [Cyclobacteriaceae bacterium]|nr:hypothetical protein [Cyclobacteriaceae bacterium]
HEAYADNPEVFIKTLRYFTIKPGYRLLMKSFYAAGFNLVAATVMPSLLGFLIAGMILLTWLQRNTTQWIAALIVILFSITPFMIEAARLSTPDMITASLLLLGVFLVIEYKIETGLILLLLTVFFRPDSAVFSVLLSVVLYARSLVRLQTGLIFLTMNIMLAVVLIGGVTLIKEFLFTTSDYSPYWSVGVGLTNYGNSLVAGGRSVIHSFTIPLLIVLILLIKFPGPLGDRWRAALMAILLALVSRYFLHPVVEDRFHVGFYLITLMACCVWVVPHIKALRSKSI